MNVNGTVTSHGGMVLLKSNTGSAPSGVVPVVLDTYDVSGLSLSDKLYIVITTSNPTGNTQYDLNAWHNTDGIKLANFGAGGNTTTSVTAWAIITANPQDSSGKTVSSVGQSISGVAAATSSVALTTAWTGSWQLALRVATQITSGTEQWSWSVYKVGGSTDLAENYPSDQQLEAGDVVSFDAVGDKKIKKATADSSALAGIVSTAPGITLGEGVGSSLGDAGLVFGQKGANDYPLALAGRVPVKFSDENGPIHVGDRLTVSKTMPGFAMKQIFAGESIGMALEDFGGMASTSSPQVASGSFGGTASSSEPPDSTPSTSSGQVTTGKILAFVNLEYWIPPLEYALNTGGSNIVSVSSGSFYFATPELIAKAGDIIGGGTNVVVATIHAVLTKVQNLWASGDIIAQGIKKTYFATTTILVNSMGTMSDLVSNWSSRSIAISNTADDTTKALFTGNSAQAADQSKVNLEQNGAYLATYGVDSTRGEIQLSGSSSLVAGEAKVFFDYSFSSVISATTPIKLITTPTSIMQGQLYVDSKSQYGFVVKELNSMDTGTFDWLVIARRKGYEDRTSSSSLNIESLNMTTPTPTPDLSTESSGGQATPSPTPDVSPSPTPAPSDTSAPTPAPSDTPTPTP